MKDIFETIATGLNMETHYVEDAYANVFEFDENDLKKKFILSPIAERAIPSDANFTSVFRQKGRFFIASHSNLDQFYNKDSNGNNADKGKYELYLKPNSVTAKSILKQLECEPKLIIINWIQREVINLFDMGADGILVEFEIDKKE